MADTITREEHNTAIQRLDAAHSELRTQIERTETRLRAEFEGKIADAIQGLKEHHTVVSDGLKDDLTRIEDHLTWQDRTVGGTIILFIMYLALHFGFHVG